jgi:hypothetical protein
LKAQRSSREPPPRPTISTSARPNRFCSSIAAAIFALDVSPCTSVGANTISTPGKRLASTSIMSRTAAPVGLVTRPTQKGMAGRGRLRSSSNSPSAASFFLSFSNFSCRAPRPSGSTRSTITWY